MEALWKYLLILLLVKARVVARDNNRRAIGPQVESVHLPTPQLPDPELPSETTTANTLTKLLV